MNFEKFLTHQYNDIILQKMPVPKDKTDEFFSESEVKDNDHVEIMFTPINIHFINQNSIQTSNFNIIHFLNIVSSLMQTDETELSENE